MGFEVEDGGMESTSTLFEKVVPVRVTKCNSEDRHMDLTARFVMGLSKVHRATKVSTKHLSLKSLYQICGHISIGQYF
jgi:hypothetical protein